MPTGWVWAGRPRRKRRLVLRPSPAYTGAAEQGARIMAASVETTIFDLLAGLAPGKSVSPEEVARAVDPDGWRRQLGHVRNTAVGLARQGKLVITRHGKPTDPNKFKGVYRLRLPLEGDVIPQSAPEESADGPGDEA
jgi:hypothetical protein